MVLTCGMHPQLWLQCQSFLDLCNCISTIIMATSTIFVHDFMYYQKSPRNNYNCNFKPLSKHQKGDGESRA